MSGDSFQSGGWRSPNKGRGVRVLVDSDGAHGHTRAHERKLVEFQVSVHEVSSSGDVGAALPATCRDISKGGFGISCRKVLYNDQIVAVVIPQKTGTPRVLFGVVRNVRYAEGGRYHLGLQMREAPQTPAVRSWLKSMGIEAKAA